MEIKSGGIKLFCLFFTVIFHRFLQIYFGAEVFIGWPIGLLILTPKILSETLSVFKFQILLQPPPGVKMQLSQKKVKPTNSKMYTVCSMASLTFCLNLE